jgi:hypothetical protein
MTDADSIWESKCRKLQDLVELIVQEREANRETRRIITALASRIPAIEVPSETPGASETGEEQQGRGERWSAAAGVQEGVQRPWWRRVFGT